VVVKVTIITNGSEGDKFSALGGLMSLIDTWFPMVYVKMNGKHNKEVVAKGVVPMGWEMTRE